MAALCLANNIPVYEDKNFQNELKCAVKYLDIGFHISEFPIFLLLGDNYSEGIHIALIGFFVDPLITGFLAGAIIALIIRKTRSLKKK